MKTRKHMLMTSLAMLVVATLALTSTGYAWFTTGNTGTVGDFNFSAQSASGILLSVDAETWKSSISSADIATQVTSDTAQSSKAQSGSLFTGEVSSFKALSTDGTVSSGSLSLFEKTNILANGNCVVAASGSDGYYVFHLYVENLSESAQLLKLSAGSRVSDVESNDKNTSLAARVAFIDQQSVVKSGTAEEIKAAVIASSGGTAGVIWEPNADTHTSYATTYYGAAAQKLAYNGVKAASGDDGYAVTNGFINAVEDQVVAVTTTDNSTATQVAELATNSITKLTVYVWIEGQDVDCSNDVAGGQVSLNLSFEASAKPEE